jgi:ribosomal protein S18 acetylase RimI-like enzyme
MTPMCRRGRREDAGFLAWAMLAASRGHLQRGVWDLIIGADEAGCLDYLSRLAVAEPRSLCHYESFWIAELEGRPAAALCTFDARGWAAIDTAMASVQRDLGWTEADIAASQRRSAPAWAAFLADIGADWYLENVATLPEFRKRGLAGLLVDQALREGRERGCRLAQLSTFIGNEAAQSVYKRSGFRLLDENRSAALEPALGAPGFARMVCEL